MAKPLKRKRKPKPPGDGLPHLAEVVEVLAKLERRLRRVERQEDVRRPIGFHTDCEAYKENPQDSDDEVDET